MLFPGFHPPSTVMCSPTQKLHPVFFWWLPSPHYHYLRLFYNLQIILKIYLNFIGILKPLFPLEKKGNNNSHLAIYLKKYRRPINANLLPKHCFHNIVKLIKAFICHLYPLISSPKFLPLKIVHNLPLCSLHSFVHLSILSLNICLTFNNLRTLFKIRKYEVQFKLKRQPWSKSLGPRSTPLVQELCGKYHLGLIWRLYLTTR